MADEPSQHFETPVSSLLSLRPRPYLLTGMFRHIMIQHFQQAGNIEDPALRGLVWKPGETTGILIESATRWRPELTNDRPAIIIKRNDFENRRVGINDQYQFNPTDLEGHRHFTAYMGGSHTLFCLSTEAAQAEILAAEVARELLQFGPYLRERLLLERFQLLGLGAVATIKGAQTTSGVPVTVGYVYTENWQLRAQVPMLRKISLQMLLDC